MVDKTFQSATEPTIYVGLCLLCRGVRRPLSGDGIVGSHFPPLPNGQTVWVELHPTCATILRTWATSGQRKDMVR